MQYVSFGVAGFCGFLALVFAANGMQAQNAIHQNLFFNLAGFAAVCGSVFGACGILCTYLESLSRLHNWFVRRWADKNDPQQRR